MTRLGDITPLGRLVRATVKPKLGHLGNFTRVDEMFGYFWAVLATIGRLFTGAFGHTVCFPKIIIPVKYSYSVFS